MLEHREDAARVGHLELRVQVHLAVDGVDEAVQALARVGVEHVGDDGELVVRSQGVEADPDAVGDVGGVEPAPLRVTEWTVPVTASMKLEAPSVAENRTVVVLRKVSAPRVRSRAMS